MSNRVEFLHIVNLSFDEHKGRLRTRELRVEVRRLSAKAKCCKSNINIRVITTFDN